MPDGDAGSLAGVALLQELSLGDLEQAAKSSRWRSYSAQEQLIDRQSEATDVVFRGEGRARCGR